MKNFQKGFTIIELLVVIAIIAVLAAIVLVNVTGYINKSKDAAIKGNLATGMTNSAVFFDGSGCGAIGSGTYAGYTLSICWTTVKEAIEKAGGTIVTSKESPTEWCGCSQLKTADTTSYCVDSTGVKKETASSTCGTDTCKDTAKSCS